MSWLLLAVAMLGALATFNVYRPRYRPSTLSVFSFFAGWLTAELALHQIALQVLVAAVLVAEGAVSAWPGWLGLATMVVSSICCWRFPARPGEAADGRARLCEGLGDDYRARILPAVAEHFTDGIAWRSVAPPFPIRHPDVERVRNIVYHEEGGHRLHLDVYRHRDRPTDVRRCSRCMGAGGCSAARTSRASRSCSTSRRAAGVVRQRRLPPQPACHVSRSTDRPQARPALDPRGRSAYGVDPDFVVVTGGSAGGHGGAGGAHGQRRPRIARLREGRHLGPRLRRVLRRVRLHRPLRRVAASRARQPAAASGDGAALADAREAYERASPMSRLGPHAPPFFVIHGDHDTMVPVEEARRFVAMLREAIPGQVAYAEIPGAQHAFEIFPSVRTLFVVQGVERFLAWVYSPYAAARARSADADEAAVG
jgi:hypothetical protein